MYAHVVHNNNVEGIKGGDFMRIIITDEMKQLEKIYDPWMGRDGKLKEDAPKEAVDAFNKEGEIIHQIFKKAGYER